jgi:Zn-dependent protease
LIAVIIGLGGVFDISQTVAWVGIAFVSILIHELGHAFVARGYGADVAIELNGFGGLTRWSIAGGGVTPGRRAIIAAAGSGVGLVFGGMVWLATRPFVPIAGLPGFILGNLIFVNLFWGLLNWLPIRPLDGGHLVESFLEKVAPRRATTLARVIFIATSALALGAALYLDLIFVAILAGWMLLSEMGTGRSRSAAPPTGMPTLDYGEPAQNPQIPSGEPVAREEPDGDEPGVG